MHAGEDAVDVFDKPLPPMRSVEAEVVVAVVPVLVAPHDFSHVIEQELDHVHDNGVIRNGGERSDSWQLWHLGE